MSHQEIDAVILTRPEEYFDLTRTRHSAIYGGAEAVWEAVARIGDYIRANLTPGIFGQVRQGAWVGGDVYIGPGTVVEPGATIKGPAIIGRNCEIRAGAYLRENVILGDGCVAGNGSELKNSLLHDEAGVPHLSYVGDSLLGWRTHLGAGVKLSNFRFDGETIIVIDGDAHYNTKLTKLGAVIGDEAEIGCNSVLNPGSLIGPRSMLYPGVVWSGALPAGRIVKLRRRHETVERIDRT